ncbi:BnaCnng32260D [Brassica napus]|uniref:BnaCnng32260D protein n=1 Tax=Brassica napus TaxID=3708 RepID=A0A078IZ35_BRANA|nr:BnaCnng32260D [Brassica napus]
MLCLQPQPVFMFANQAGLDMLETTLVALQDIPLKKIFDESGICVLAFRNLFVYNGGHVTYEEAVAWKVFAVSDNDNNNNLHCLAFSFVNWSFV